jgi:beta-lactamase regulating signal transducer with metallopeptidase domain
MIGALMTLPPNVMIQALGWSLIHFLWQGSLLAAVLWASLLLAKKPAVRYAMAFGILVVMTLMPVVNFVLLNQEPSTNVIAGKSATLSNYVSGAPSPDYFLSRQFGTHDSSFRHIAGIDAGTAAVWIWFSGVLLFSVRTVGGWILLRQLRRGLSSLSDELHGRCRALQHRFGIAQSVGFFHSIAIDAPAVLGWFRPIVLLPLSTLAGLSPDQFEAIIAHELAHIKRFDYLANLFQLFAETVLFYHPAVWWVNRVIRTERENCCDDLAVSVAGSAFEYVRALAHMEKLRSVGSFALAANGGSLMARISRLLGRPVRPRPGIAAVVLAVLGLTGSLLAASRLSGGVFDLFQIDRYSQYPSVTTASAIPVSPDTRQQVVSNVKQTTTVDELLLAQASPAPKPQASSTAKPQPAAKSAAVESGSSYISDLAAAGYKNLTADQLVALKIQGVTPQYVSEVKASGLNPDTDQLITMKVQGIDGQYVRYIRATGLAPNLDEIIAMKVQGVTPEYIQQVRAGGWNPTADQIIAMKVQGVKPSDASEYTKLGLSKLTVDQLIAFRVQGITPEYIQSIRSAGFTNLSADDYIGMKVQGVTPEYIQQIRAGGWNPTADQIVAMKVQGVKPSDASEYTKLGLPKLTVDQLIAFRVQGITPGYIQSIRSAGFTNLNADDYIGMKVQGVTPEFINRARQHGFKDLTAHQIIALKAAGVL